MDEITTSRIYTRIINKDWAVRIFPGLMPGIERILQSPYERILEGPVRLFLRSDSTDSASEVSDVVDSSPEALPARPKLIVSNYFLRSKANGPVLIAYQEDFCEYTLGSIIDIAYGINRNIETSPYDLFQLMSLIKHFFYTESWSGGYLSRTEKSGILFYVQQDWWRYAELSIGDQVALLVVEDICLLLGKKERIQAVKDNTPLYMGPIKEKFDAYMREQTCDLVCRIFDEPNSLPAHLQQAQI